MEKSKLAAAMFIVGSIGLFVHYIPLPPAVIAMLIVYCLRGVTFTAPAGWAPALIAAAAVAALHLWKKNNLLSILGGTVLYMVLVQAVF